MALLEVCYKLGSALRSEDVEHFFLAYDRYLSADSPKSLEELNSVKEAARQISDLSSEDFSLIRSVSLSESGNQPFPVTDGGNVSSQLSSLLDKFRPDLLCDSGTASDMEAADTVKAGEDDGCEQTAVVDLDVSTGLSLGVSSFEPCPPSITALDARHTTLPDVEAAMSATATSPEHKQTDTGQNDAEQTEIATDAETSSSTEHTAAPDISVEHTTAPDISVEHTIAPDISAEHSTATDINAEHSDISAEHSTATDINAEHSDINAEHSTATDINVEHTTAADVNAEHTTVIDSATLSTCADDTPVEQASTTALDVNVEHTSTALTTPPDIEPATTATDDVRAATVPEGQHTTSPNTAPEASAKNTTNSTPDVEPIIAEQELVVETKRRKESPSPAKSSVVSSGNHRKRNYASRKQKRLEERIKSERTCTVPGPTEHEQKLQTRDQELEAEEVQFNHEEVVQFLWQGWLDASQKAVFIA